MQCMQKVILIRPEIQVWQQGKKYTGDKKHYGKAGFRFKCRAGRKSIRI